MKEIEKAILRTLAYAGLFNYPLTAPEIWKYLIASRQIPRSVLEKELGLMSTDWKRISTDRKYYFCMRQNRIVRLRDKRAVWSEKKLKRAKIIAAWLRCIPTVKMISVTGALAMLNAGKKDDIDLMFVVSPRRVWLTRGLIVFVLRLLGRYRRPGKTQDRICPNLFLDTEHLGLAVSERNLFTAHEIAQAKCLWEKEGTYDRFLAANRWVLEYLPNAFIQNQKSKIKNQNVVKKSKFCILLCHYSFCTLILDFLEKMAFKAQLFYMHSKRTREITDPGRIFFHPRDRGSEILLKYQKRLTELGIPSVFQAGNVRL